MSYCWHRRAPASISLRITKSADRCSKSWSARERQRIRGARAREMEWGERRGKDQRLGYRSMAVWRDPDALSAGRSDDFQRLSGHRPTGLRSLLLFCGAAVDVVVGGTGWNDRTDENGLSPAERARRGVHGVVCGAGDAGGRVF